MSYKVKCIFKLMTISIIIFFTSACNTSLPLKETDDNSAQIAKTITDNISVDATLSLPTQEQSETITIITIDEMDEKTFIENLDIDTLNTVAKKIQELTDEIVKKQAETPESVIKGEWVTDFRNSEQYQYVLDFGVKAIKPMYYILYKSEQAGLYEYILSSAMNDIIGFL